MNGYRTSQFVGKFLNASQTEAIAAPVGLGCVHWFEDLFAKAGRNARPGIGHRKHHAIANLLDRHIDDPRPIHSIDGVQTEIHQHLLNVGGVRRNAAIRMAREFEVVMRGQQSPHKQGSLGSHLAQRGHWFQPPVALSRQKLSSQFGAAFSGRYREPRISRFGKEHSHAIQAVEQNHDFIVKVMRDSTHAQNVSSHLPDFMLFAAVASQIAA